MNVRRHIIVISTLACILIALIGYMSWKNHKNFVATTTWEFQQDQLNFVRQLAGMVRTNFEKLHDALYALSQMPAVQFMDTNTCLMNMIRVFKMNDKLVEGIFRVDAANRLRYAYPQGLEPIAPEERQPTSRRGMEPVAAEELQPIFDQARMTGSSVFKVIRQHHDGSDILVVAKPVYTVQGKVHLNPSNKFSGLLFFTIPLHQLQEKLFDVPTSGKKSSLWMIDEQGLLVGTAKKSRIGKTLHEISSAELSPSEREGLLNIVERMRTGTEGMATYWPGIRQDVAKLTAYAPLHLPDQTWSIAVTNPKEDVTLSIDQAISEQWINGLVFLSTTIGVAALLIFTITRNNQHQIKMLEVQQEKQQEKLQSETESERHLSIAQMIAGVTHDLNTPLGIVNHAASILVETLAPKSIPALAKDESAQAILTEVVEVSTLIQKNIAQAVRLLQSFKHHTVRQVAVRKEQVDLLQLIEEEVVGLYKLKARGSQLDLEVVDKLGDLDRRWEGYPGYFSQILLNLLTNIDRYAYPEGQGGKVKIIVSRDDSEGVESSFSVVVQDFGCGIPPSDLPKVFELFYTTGRDKGGTGLGLAMVYKLVTSSLQGTVRIESAAGEGTRVLISLPQTIKGTSEAEGQNEELVSQNAISG